MTDHKRELELAIGSDFHKIKNAAWRLTARVLQYSPYASSADALCEAEDCCRELKKVVSRLEDALTAL